MANTASTRHIEYDKAFAGWAVVRDAVSGNVKRYLRNVGASEQTPSAQEQRQREYEACVYYYNFTERTLDGMQGAVFRDEPDVELPPSLEYLLTNADGNGQGLTQQSQDAFSENAQVGRLGLFADMPVQTEKTNLSDQINGEFTPKILIYTAENITNWRVKRIGAVNKLVLVVLREYYEEIDPANVYNVIRHEQYRTLMLDEDGYYIQKLERETDNGDTVTEEYQPRANGQRMKHIPFTFVGAKNNDYVIDRPPLKAMADLNIAHYRNTADDEEQLHTCAQAMLIIAPGESISADDWMKLNPNGVKFGSRRGVNVGAGGNAFLLQAVAGNALSAAIIEKEERAVKIGGQLITPTTQQTAEAARIQKGADTSVAASITKNVTQAYNDAIQWCADYLGETGEFKFQLSTDFLFDGTLSAQDIDAMVRTWQAGAISKSVLDDAFVKAKIISSEVDLDEMNDAIDEEQGEQGGVDFSGGLGDE